MRRRFMKTVEYAYIETGRRVWITHMKDDSGDGPEWHSHPDVEIGTNLRA